MGSHSAAIAVRDGRELDGRHPEPAAGFDDAGDTAEIRMLGADATDGLTAVGVESDHPDLRLGFG